MVGYIFTVSNWDDCINISITAIFYRIVYLFMY